jgi:hypothetical protein
MRRWSRQFVVALVLAVGLNGVANAEWQQSSNYGMNESEAGAMGDFSGASAGYSFIPSADDSGTTLGEAARGSSSSANYASGSGFNTTAQPGLTLIVNTSLVSLGVLSTGAAQFGTATFSVKNYTSYGYVVQVVGTAPTYSGHTLTALATDTASSAGTEQFGVNTVLNTSAGQGADPVQVPSSSFSYGVAGDGGTGTFGTTRPYTIPDKYRYVAGETVASAPKSSGETDYTMTFMANQGNTTPSGHYSGSMTLVATGTY